MCGISARFLISLVLLTCFTGTVAVPAFGEEIRIPVCEDQPVFDLPENEGMALLREMKTGWNLGNTFDAYDDTGWYRGPQAEMETIWGNPATTRGMIQQVYDAGFRTLRLPVSWHNHVDDRDQIDPAWLSRVREVADWALELGMYVIVNTHHDNQQAFYYPTEEFMPRSEAYLTSVWTQLAEAFRDCDEHLILEAMNEPRLVGTAWEWSWSAESEACLEAADCINCLNQLFVDTVRATGGGNATRYLAVPSYAANGWNACEDAFRMPEDPAGRVILSVHAYIPYSFALDTSSSDATFSDREEWKKEEIARLMNLLYDHFVSRGIPVLLDEYGALEKNGHLQDRVNFAAWYTACASARGITCCWWDNGLLQGEGERFGLLNRKEGKWVYPEIVQAIMKNCLIHREEGEI